MKPDVLVKRLLEAEDFDPSAEVDRIMGPISMDQFRAWLDEAGLAAYQVKFADWNEKNVLVYHGAIDNSSSGEEITKTYLRDAVEATLSGRPVEKKNANAIGCSIKRV